MNHIAIFGDSFASRMHLEIPPTEEKFLKALYKLCGRVYNKTEVKLLRDNWGKRYIPWVNFLGADVYAHSGSDLYYSYNQFVKRHHTYEKCIFVITGSLRFSSFATNEWLHCGSIDDAIEKIEFSSDRKTKKYFTTLASFFKDIYYQDMERIEYINRAMIDSIKSIRPDTIFINAFPDLKNVYELELKTWNLTHDQSQDYTNYIDLRQCHMTNANNEILAKKILDNLDESGLLDLSDVEWKIPSIEDRCYYLPNTQDLFTRLL